MTGRDTAVLAGVGAPVLLLHLVFFKEFLFVSFDQETARTLGYAVERWNLLLYLTLGVVIAFAMRFARVLLVFNFLVLPAVTGLMLGGGVGVLFGASAVAAALAATAGFAASVTFDLPTGPAIIAASGVLAALAWGVRRMRGGAA